MFLIEFHDDELDNQTAGTLAAKAGDSGTIEYSYQAEMHVQDHLERNWRRAYLKTADKIKAIWERNFSTGEVRYLARDPSYDGEWELPFVSNPDARIAVGIWGVDVSTDKDAIRWAQAQLSDAITAIILERGDIRFAWELVDGRTRLIAIGPPALQ